MCSHLAQNQGRAHKTYSSSHGTHWCPPELCNGAATGLHNVLVQTSKRKSWVPAQLARPGGALAGFQTPLAPFVRHKDHISVHGAQLTLP